MTDLVMRPLSAGEEPLFGSLADPGLAGLAAFGDAAATWPPVASAAPNGFG